MKRLFSYITMLLLAAPLWAQSDCETAPLINESFTIPSVTAGDYWISAWTYDLPLNMVFTPSGPIATPPTAELDFRCGTGDYPTQELQDLFYPPSDGDVVVRIEMPARFTFTQTGDGSYSFAVPESYRDMMFRVGITEDIQAYVKLHFPAPGSVGMAPSEEFRDCVGEGLDSWVTLGDTLVLDATNENETFVCPVALWKNDSIRFVWTGDEEAELTFHYTCDVDGDYLGNTMVSDYYTIPAHGEVRLSQAEVKALFDEYAIIADMVDLPVGSTEGLYYAFVTRSGVGKLVIEKTPISEADEGAYVLSIGETVQVTDSNQIFCFPRTWTEALRFSTPTNHLMSVYFSVQGSWELPSSLDSISFVRETENGRFAGLNQVDLKNLTDAANSINNDYVYIRFVCDKPTTVTVTLWGNECAASYANLNIRGTNSTPANKNLVYKVLYADIEGYDLSIKWQPTASKTNNVYFADTCDYSSMSQTEHRIWYQSFSANQSKTITAATIATWADRVDDDGYIYLRANSTASGKLVVTTQKPEDTGGEDEEPEPEPEPETCKETEYKAEVTVEQYCDTLLPYKWQVYEGREVMIATKGTYYDTIFSYLSDGTRCDSVIYTLSLDTIHCERPAPEPPTGGEGEEEGDGEEGDEGDGEGEEGGTGGNQNTPNPPVPGPGFPEPNYPTGSVIYRGAQTISATCTADGAQEIRITKAQELRLMQGSVELERWTQQPGDVHRLTLREGVTYTLRGLETLYLRR